MYFILFFAANILGITDALLTLTAINIGFAYEANPLMAYLIDINPLLFYVVKTIMMVGGTAFLWYHSHQFKLAKYMLIFSLAFYALVNIVHAYNFTCYYG